MTLPLRQEVEEEKGIFSPFWSVFSLACISFIIYIFSIPQHIAAFLISFWFIVITLLNPVNGIYFIILCVPFFLGDSKRPYFLILEFFLYVTIISAIIHKNWIQNKKWILPYIIYPVLFFLAVTILSFPVNIKELLLELRTWPIMESLRILGNSHEGYNMYYLRSLLNSISSIVLFIIVVNFIDTPKKVINIFVPLIVTSAVTIIIGILFLFEIIPHGNSYLSLSLVGKAQGGMTAFAYNPLYLCQYITLILPIGGFCILSVKNIKVKIFYLFCIAILIIALALTSQKIPYLVLLGQAFFFVFTFLYFLNTKRKNFIWTVSFFLFLIMLFLSIDHIFSNGTNIRDLIFFWNPQIKEYHMDRINLMKIAWLMAVKYSLLGVGLGKYHFFFPEYADLIPQHYPGWLLLRLSHFRSSAHNVYMHILGEQGVMGLVSFLFLITTIFYYALKYLRRLSYDKSLIVITLTTSLIGWLISGITENPFYIRSMQISFWILAGFLAVILKPYMELIRISKRSMFIMGMIFMLLLGHRIYTASSYYIKSGFSAGFYRYEQMANGRKARWMTRKAIIKLEIKGNILILKAAALLPGLEHHPQKLFIYTSQGYHKEIIFKNQNWKHIRIPVNREGKNCIWVRMRTAYTIIPKRLSLNNDQRILGVLLEDPRWIN